MELTSQLSCAEPIGLKKKNFQLMSRSLFKDVRIPSNLRTAWKYVQSHAARSKSSAIRDEAKLFAQHDEANIQRIARNLKNGTFAFTPSTGVLKKREGKSHRPIVLAPIENKIVQRAILQKLQNHRGILPLLKNPGSYGGIEGRGVESALTAVYDGISRERMQFFVKTDIREFFTRIPKGHVIALISEAVDDADFVDLLKAAIEVELENMALLGTDASLFPLFDEGVAQGCCLSPLMGNLLLAEFDAAMNQPGVRTIRYIDDLLILGKDEKSTMSVFRTGKKILDALNLEIYDPNQNSAKASKGTFSGANPGVEFLGCKILVGKISPTRKARDRVVASIKSTLESCVANFSNPIRAARCRNTLVDALSDANNILQGWANQYRFCNAPAEMRDVDEKIDGLIRSYLGKYDQAKRKLDDLGVRRILGVRPARDVASQPIVRPKKTT